MRQGFRFKKSDILKEANNIEEQIEAVTEAKLVAIARDAIEFSKFGSNPASSGVGMGGGVDTGAYITSFSFITGRGRPRGKSSKGRPRRQDPHKMGDIGFQQLMSDIQRVDLKNTTSVVLNNGAPHAPYVENKHGLLVFSKLRNKYG
jgi:hypothetical protein